jgi:hypothetical protein
MTKPSYLWEHDDGKIRHIDTPQNESERVEHAVTGATGEPVTAPKVKKSLGSRETAARGREGRDG